MIQYVTGDATKPIGDGPKIIAHICNDLGKWGKGFVLALSKRWTKPEREYRALIAREQVAKRRVLGTVQFVSAERDIVIANMIAQRGVAHDARRVVDYVALSECLHLVSGYAIEIGASVHMPRIGTGLGGGDWAHVEEIIVEKLGDVSAFVYDLPVER